MIWAFATARRICPPGTVITEATFEAPPAIPTLWRP